MITDITTHADGSGYHPPHHFPSGRAYIALAFALLTLNLVGCATVGPAATFRSVPCVHGCPQAPVTLRNELKSGSPVAEVAMGQREIEIMHFADAQFWFRQAAAQSDPAGEYRVGLDYALGRGTEESRAKSLYWIRKAALQGYTAAEYAIGLDYQYGRGVPRSFVKAIHWLRGAAVQGFATAQYALGYDFGRGLGVTQNYATANYWFRKAALQGLAAAEFALGMDDLAGRGCARHAVAGNRWLRKAAEQGGAPAEYLLGINYDLGRGVPNNTTRGQYWFRKAAMSGFPPAEAAVGIDYELGRGTARNYRKGYVWLRKAAAQNVTLAEYYLGAAYYRGRGVPKSAAKAQWWWRKAKANGPFPSLRNQCRMSAQHSDYVEIYRHAIQASAKTLPAGTSPPGIKSDFPQPCGFYPEVSQILDHQGTAIVHVCIGANGRLAHRPTILRSTGFPRLDAAALRYVRATSGYWTPAHRHGKAVELCEKWPVRFRLSKPIQGTPETTRRDRAKSLTQ